MGLKHCWYGVVTIAAMTSSTNKMTKRQAWLKATRPRTLPLALASIGMGIFLAFAHGRGNWLVAVLCIVTTIFLQVLSNLANDYGDSVHGADSDSRQGPQRAVQMGLISAGEMRRAMAVCALLAVVSGLVLVYVAFGLQQGALLLLFVGLGGAAVWAAVAYTATSNPYGYVGLGDFFVLLFFGWVGTLGSYFAQTNVWDGLVFWPATAVGLFAVGVLNINNIRDIESDRAAGKQSLPVRMGRVRAQRYHWFLLMGGLVCALVYVGLAYRSPWQFLFVLVVPLLWRNGTAVSRLPSAQLDPLLKQLSLTTLLFIVTFGVGQLLAAGS